MSEIILSTFYKFLVNSIPDSVVKFGKEAREHESLESKKQGDLFVSASLKTDTLLSYSYIPDEVLRSAGLNEDEIKKYSNDLYSIPDSKKNTVLNLARKWYISTYEEQNNYYRKINGLPDIDSEYEIWLPDFSLYEDYGLEPCPLHEIPHMYLKALESRGVIKELMDLYPDQEFLHYVGKRKVDIVSARRADNFEMLYFPNVTDSYSFYKNFLMIYEECRQYFLTIVYNSFYSTKYEEYDGYIGFTILTFAINRMIVSNFKAFVERDFYDEFSTQTFLNAYGVPYSTRFTLSQMKLIAKQLNILLRVKETDLALLDVIDLLGYHDFTLMKYYLVKQHRLDNDGNPVFEYKTDETTGEQVPDFDKMYNLHFSRVSVKEDNVQEAIRDITNKENYTKVTLADPYWIDDIDLQNKIKSTKFNYIETKYMDLTVIYRMYKIIFEIVYFTRIILDNGRDSKNVHVSMAKLSSTDIPIFDIMILLICLVCKLYKVEPNILNTPSKALHIAGFNYNADIDAIREDIANHPDTYDQEILKYINNVIFTSPEDINNFFVQIRNLDIKLTSLLNNATTLKSYRAYRKLYDTLMYIDISSEIYKLPNGRVPTKFSEYLEAVNPDLYYVYNTTETDDDVSNMVAYITARLMNIFTDTRYLNHIQVLNTSFIEALLKLLEYFKSLTVDLRGINMIILFDSRLFNGAHFYQHMKMSTTDINIDYWSMTSTFWVYAKKIQASMDLTSEQVTDDDLARAIVDCYIGSTKLIPYDKKTEEEKIYPKDYLATAGDFVYNMSVSMEDLQTVATMEENYRLLSLLTGIDKMCEHVKLNALSNQTISGSIYMSYSKLINHILQNYRLTISTKDVERMITDLYKILNIKVIPKLDSIITSNIDTSIAVDVDSDKIVSWLYQKDYKKVEEYFVVMFTQMILRDGTIKEDIKETMKELSQNININNAVSVSDTMKIVRGE